METQKRGRGRPKGKTVELIKTLGFREEDDQRLKELAEAEGISEAAVVRRLIQAAHVRMQRRKITDQQWLEAAADPRLQDHEASERADEEWLAAQRRAPAPPE